ncbi:MAG: hypothetical protein K1W14_17835 [Muribaculaceae bacterium]
MNNKKLKTGCLYFTLALYVSSLIALVAYCSRDSLPYREYVDELGIYLTMEEAPGLFPKTVVISFAEEEDSLHRNRFEVPDAGEYHSCKFYFVVDNTGEDKNIKTVFFNEYPFHYYHILDYSHTVLPYFIFFDEHGYGKFSDLTYDFRELRDGEPLPLYYMVKIQQMEYNRGFYRSVYEIDRSRDIDRVVDSLRTNDHFVPIKDFWRRGIPTGFDTLCRKYGIPEKMDWIVVDEDNKRSLVEKGLRFIDTMATTDRRLRLEKVTWKVDTPQDTYLRIFYKIGDDSRRIPVDGLRYKDYIDKEEFIKKLRNARVVNTIKKNDE